MALHWQETNRAESFWLAIVSNYGLIMRKMKRIWMTWKRNNRKNWLYHLIQSFRICCKRHSDLGIKSKPSSSVRSFVRYIFLKIRSVVRRLTQLELSVPWCWHHLMCRHANEHQDTIQLHGYIRCVNDAFLHVAYHSSSYFLLFDCQGFE